MKYLLAGLLFVLAQSARAQDSVIVIDPDAVDSTDRQAFPEELVRRILTIYNDPATTRLWGDVDLPRESRIAGTIAVYRGSVRLAGSLDGSLTVINGSLLMLPGSSITGDVLVVGGRITINEGATIGGRREEHWDAAPLVRSPEGVLVQRARRRLPDLTTARRSFQAGPLRATVLLGTEGTYNRVEGLPIVFGPLLDWRFNQQLTGRIEVRGILRSAADDDQLRDDFGYFARAELRINGSRGMGLGSRAYSVVNPIEEHPFSKSEVGWSAFLFQRDQRDYYLQKGVAGYFYVYPTRTLRLETSLRHDKEQSVRANDPWSLFRNSDRWRANPLIDDGHYTTLGFSVEVDTRNDDDLPTSGWWLRTVAERSWSNDVAPIALPGTVRDAIPTAGDYAFNRLNFDLRRYNRIATNLRLNARLTGSGYAGGDPLPIQRRVSLGGSDLLPGYDFRAFTCAPAGFNDGALSALCDRMMVAQVEFRTRLDLGLGYRYQDQSRREVDRFIGIDQADAVLFLDAGKAWLSGDGPGRVPDDRVPALKEWKADIGIGLDAGGLGLYLSRALTDGQPVRFSFRINRRF
jgi:Omp85 superfamily domain